MRQKTATIILNTRVPVVVGQDVDAGYLQFYNLTTYAILVELDGQGEAFWIAPGQPGGYNLKNFEFSGKFTLLAQAVSTLPTTSNTVLINVYRPGEPIVDIGGGTLLSGGSVNLTTPNGGLVGYRTAPAGTNTGVQLATLDYSTVWMYEAFDWFPLATNAGNNIYNGSTSPTGQKLLWPDGYAYTQSTANQWQQNAILGTGGTTGIKSIRATDSLLPISAIGGYAFTSIDSMWTAQLNLAAVALVTASLYRVYFTPTTYLDITGAFAAGTFTYKALLVSPFGTTTITTFTTANTTVYALVRLKSSVVNSLTILNAGAVISDVQPQSVPTLTVTHSLVSLLTFTSLSIDVNRGNVAAANYNAVLGSQNVYPVVGTPYPAIQINLQ